MNIECHLCTNIMEEFTSDNNKNIYMCPCCGSIHLSKQTINDRVDDYEYYRNGNFVSTGRTIPTTSQMLYLTDLIKKLEVKVNLNSITKNEARKLISVLKEKYEEKYRKEHCCLVNGIEIEKIKEGTGSVWIDHTARIDDRKWIEDYKNKLHPNDDLTNINIETYCRWIYKINNEERNTLIEEALKADIVGFLD